MHQIFTSALHEQNITVVENAGGGRKLQVVVGGDLGVVPTVFVVPVDGDHVVGEMFAKSGVGEVFG